MERTEVGRKKSLKPQLERLPPKHRTAFAATCCERLLPNYSEFTRQVEWDEPDTLRGSRLRLGRLGWRQRGPQ